MLAWVVISRLHPRRSPLSRSFRLPSHSLLSTVVHPLSIQPLRKCSFHNSFASNTIHFNGGMPPLATFRVSPLAILLKFFLFILLRTLLHSQNCQPFCFQAIPHSLPTTTRGAGRDPFSKQNPACRITLTNQSEGENSGK